MLIYINSITEMKRVNRDGCGRSPKDLLHGKGVKLKLFSVSFAKARLSKGGLSRSSRVSLSVL